MNILKVLVLSLLLQSTFFSVRSLAAELKFEAKKVWSLPADFKIQSHRVGGLSGCSILEDKIYLVSDDRGNVSGPRIFIAPFDSQKAEINFKKVEVLNIKPELRQIIDLEGIGVLDKDQIFLSNEGDLNQKPRQNPEMFWMNSKTKRTKEVVIPDEFLPERSGQQTKGVRNNLAFEGFVVDAELKKWAAMTEASLFQKPGELKLIESDLHSLQFDHIYGYPAPKAMVSKKEESAPMIPFFGVSEILMLDANSYLVLERGVSLSAQGMVYRTQFCEATKQEGSPQLQRTCHYSMNQDEKLKAEIPAGANFEGLCWVNKQKKQFIAVSDNNFSKSDKTVFILYQLN